MKYPNSLVLINAQDKSPIYILNDSQRFVVRLLPFYITFRPAIEYTYLFILIYYP